MKRRESQKKDRKRDGETEEENKREEEGLIALRLQQKR